VIEDIAKSGNIRQRQAEMNYRNMLENMLNIKFRSFLDEDKTVWLRT